MGKPGERVRQLKRKRPGYGEILDFYSKVRELQDRSKSSLKTDPIKLEKDRKDLLAREGFPLIRKEDFPLDIEASIRLFRSLCRIGKGANPHMAGQVEKIRDLLGNKKMDLKKLFEGGVNEEKIGQVAAESGLERTIFSFLVQSSIRPSIEAGVEQLRGGLDPETWRKGHCPVCGSPPSLSLLKGEEGRRYLLCSFCGYQWRTDRLSCPACDNKDQESLGYFCGEERRPSASISAIDAIGTSRRSITETWKNPIPAWKISPPSTSTSWPPTRGIKDPMEWGTI